MNFIIIFAYLIIVSSALSILTKTTIGKTISSTIFITILLLYISGILGSLKFGLVLCGLVFIVAIVILAIGFIKGTTKKLNYILTPALLIFTLFFVFSWQSNSLRLLSSWDEFSHWGLTAKNMFYLDVLGSSSKATTYFKGYPPATALFQYFWSKLYGSFAEGNLFRATNILNFSLLLPLFNIQRKNRSVASYLLLVLILTMLPVAFYATFYSNTYVDATLGLLFSYILYTYFTSELTDGFSKVNIVLATSVLVLTKASGMGLAVIAFLIILIDYTVFRRKESLVKCLKFLVPYFMTILLANQSWKLFLKLTKSKIAWDTSLVNLTNIFKLLKGEGQPYQYQTYESFIHKIMGEPFSPRLFNMTVFFWMAVSVMLSLYILHIAKSTEAYYRIKLSIIGIQVGALIYCLSLLVLYLYTYSVYEALNLASFDRYISTYLLGLFVYLIGLLIYYYDQTMEYKTHKRQLLITFFSLLLFTNVDAFASTFFVNGINKKKITEMRNQFIPVEKARNEIEDKNSRVYFISQNTNGLDYWIARFTFTPLAINDNITWSLGEKYDEKDQWTKDISIKEWSNQLKSDFDYVFIYRSDDAFKEKYGDLFKGGLIEVNTLYKVQLIEGEDFVTLEKFKK